MTHIQINYIKEWNKKNLDQKSIQFEKEDIVNIVELTIQQNNEVYVVKISSSV